MTTSDVSTVLADANPELEGQVSRDLSLVTGDGTCCTTDPSGATSCC